MSTSNLNYILVDEKVVIMNLLVRKTTENVRRTHWLDLNRGNPLRCRTVI